MIIDAKADSARTHSLRIPAVCSMNAALCYYAEKTPDKTYIICDGSIYSYSQVNALVNRVCAWYASLRIQRGDVVSAIIKNGVEYVLLYLASLRYGCTFNPYPYSLEARDVIRYLRFITPNVLFCQTPHYDEIQGLEKPSFATYDIHENFIASLPKDVKQYPDCVPETHSPACVYYSSGTTGNPKGIIISHRNMMANIAAIVRNFGFTDQTTHLIVLPLGHTAAINYSFLPATLSGGAIVIAESFWKIRMKLWQYIAQYRIGYIEVVPSILVAMLNTPYVNGEWKGISLPYIGCGSSTLQKELQVSFWKKFSIKVANLYGLSETGPTHFDNPLEAGWEPGSVGKPLDVNSVVIMDPDGNILGPGEQGEIAVKGENVFVGYYKNPSLYRAVVKRGFFHTGDLGYIADDGSLFFLGRLKELIIKGGVNICPDEIDEVLFQMNEIKEALTIGVPDQYLGEKIVSYVVLCDGAAVTESDILNFCKQYLSRDKLPDHITFSGDLPKGSSGKLLRKKLRDAFGTPQHKL